MAKEIIYGTLDFSGEKIIFMFDLLKFGILQELEYLENAGILLEISKSLIIKKISLKFIKNL